jgi:tungstate transport system ATP-binding protein
MLPLYEIDHLKFGYNNNFLLELSNFIIAKGDSIGLIGPNGSGKSSMLKLLAFLEFPAEGYIRFNGKDVSGREPGIRENVTMLLQDPYLLKKTVFDNIAYGLRVRRKSDNLRSMVFQALDWVGLPGKKFSNKKWFELSGGEAQRVALASRLVLKPDVLILDEPTVSVDTLSASLIKEAIKFIRKEYNTSLIISSHDILWLNTVTDNIYRIYDGRIVGLGHENLIEGPWINDIDDLWVKNLNERQKIYAVNPPHENAAALLNPCDIVISLDFPTGISAQNILKGSIKNMSITKESNVNLDIEVSGISISSYVTQHAAKELELLPGKYVWIVFKANSLHWQ